MAGAGLCGATSKVTRMYAKQVPRYVCEGMCGYKIRSGDKGEKEIPDARE